LDSLNFKGINSDTTSFGKAEFDVPSWDQIYYFLLNISKAIIDDAFEPEVIVGISRGGWIPARIMSDLLENPKLANVRTEFYSGIAENKDKPLITQPISLSVKGKKVLLVDDVADTGESLQLVISHVEEDSAAEIRSATLYLKPWSIVVPNYYQKETRSWVIFPWEKKEAVRKTVEKFRMEGRTLEEIENKLIFHGFEKYLIEMFIKEMFG
jgi:hypoxanthine phosphoribosyltransferase